MRVEGWGIGYKAEGQSGFDVFGFEFGVKCQVLRFKVEDSLLRVEGVG